MSRRGWDGGLGGACSKEGGEGEMPQEAVACSP